MSLTAVTVLKSGGCFSPVWVERLNRDIRRFLGPDRIVCLTDMDVTDCEVIPLRHNWPGWFSKMELFRPGLFEDDEIVFYADLDSLILKPWSLDNIVAPKPLLMLCDFYRPAIPASGLMLWLPGERISDIYERFAKNPRFSKRFSEGDGALIGPYCTARIQHIWPGLAGSYKADKLQNGPKGFSVVCAHGTPKWHELADSSWAKKYWITGQLPATG